MIYRLASYIFVAIVAKKPISLSTAYCDPLIMRISIVVIDAFELLQINERARARVTYNGRVKCEIFTAT